MVARINCSKSISKALNYNEQKVQQGKAEMLSAEGFIRDAERLSFHDKMKQFNRHISLNENASTNTLHVSLNFDPSETITNEKLMGIAAAYMEGIGFGKQPYLVYRHHDSGHPHIHIVSTNIESNVNRVSMHNLGRNQSENARRKIEEDFGLVKADSKKLANEFKPEPLKAQRFRYGKLETKGSIANVLTVVLNQYKFSSLPELNAVLKLYNVSADRGCKDSRIFQKNGLLYRVLDDAGNKIGVPIKASAFYMKPTLANLEKIFVKNEMLKAPFKKRLQTTIGWVLVKGPTNMEVFIRELAKENISTVLRIGKGDVIYGITYVDHKSKTAFNGSDLGVALSAKAVLDKCQQLKVLKSENLAGNHKESLKTELSPDKQFLSKSNPHESKLSETFPSHAPGADYIPYQLQKRKRKKKKRMSI